jgi:hypothetical protein
MSLDASAPTKEAPRVPAEWHGDEWRFFCQPCQCWHHHGGHLGPVSARCIDLSSPYFFTGYRLTIAGEAPYGYRDDGTGEGLVSDPAEDAVTWQILDLKREGLSLQGIAADLNAQAVRTRHGRSWTAQAVAKVLAIADSAVDLALRKAK